MIMHALNPHADTLAWAWGGSAQERVDVETVPLLKDRVSAFEPFLVEISVGGRRTSLIADVLRSWPVRMVLPRGIALGWPTRRTAASEDIAYLIYQNVRCTWDGETAVGFLERSRSADIFIKNEQQIND
jgi:hypothetical protein